MATSSAGPARVCPLRPWSWTSSQADAGEDVYTDIYIYTHTHWFKTQGRVIKAQFDSGSADSGHSMSRSPDG